MDISRREFLEATSGAAILSAIAPRAAAGADDDPLGVRKDFPATSEYTFLNTAYIGLISKAVVAAGQDWLEARARRTYSVGDMMAKTDEARKTFARLVNATPEEIGFLFSTSEGENIVTRSLDLKAGENVVMDDLVYPSTQVIHKHLEKMNGIEVRVVKHQNGATRPEDFAKLVDRKTRLISVAWVSNMSGYRQDTKALAEIAHANGAYLYADAVQFIGTAPVDVRTSGVDFFTTGAYKWLMAGFGVAPFYVRRELLDRIQPDRMGWRLANQEAPSFRTAQKFEFASLSFGEVYQLAAALTYMEKIGLSRIETQSQALVQQLRKGLTDRGFRIFTPEGNRSSIVSFYIKKPIDQANKIFNDAAVKVSVQNGDRTEQYGGTDAPVARVRVALSFFNNAADVQRFLDVSEKLSTT